MRISYVTAGAGGMYCGSCLRDNTLAAALTAAGHDVLLIPTYTPTRTDEPNVSHGRVFLGGINVFLQQHYAFFRKTPWMMDRLWDLAPVLRLASRLGISVDPTHLGKLTVSILRGTSGFQRKEILKLVRFLAEEARPDIINLPNSMLISLAPAIKAELEVPVCCTLQGEDLFLNSLEEPYRSEALRLIREHSEHVDAFMPVSGFCADYMAGLLETDPRRMRVVPMGIHFDGYRRPNGLEPDTFTVGYLARIAPEKGLHLLCESYRRLRELAGTSPSRLLAAGYLPPEQRPYLAGIQKSLESWQLSGHFHYHGTLNRPEKLAFLRGLSLLSVPGPYDDPKGFFLLEAMAGGVPVAQPRRGAFKEIVEITGGGILVEPDDPDALAEAMLDLWRNPDKRMELGSRGYEGVRAHFSAARMAEKALDVYRSLLLRRS